MKKLKITRSIPRESGYSNDDNPLCESTDERYKEAESKFEKKTGLKEGAKVHYIGISDVQLENWRNKYSDPRTILNSETIYEIEYIEIHRSYTIIKLVGFREEKFNGIIFKAVDITEPKKGLQIGDMIRYIGLSEHTIDTHSAYCSNPSNKLIYESIYEVKSIERHPSFLGLKFVTLVGFCDETFNRILFEKVITPK